MLESLWGGKKMAAHKQIRPIIRRSNKLKQVASPSVKQCLEIYEQPTVHDRYTGKVRTLGSEYQNAPSYITINNNIWVIVAQFASKVPYPRCQHFLSFTLCCLAIIVIFTIYSLYHSVKFLMRSSLRQKWVPTARTGTMP